MDVGGGDREGALVGLGREVEVMDVGHGAFAGDDERVGEDRGAVGERPGDRDEGALHLDALGDVEHVARAEPGAVERGELVAAEEHGVLQQVFLQQRRAGADGVLEGLEDHALGDELGGERRLEHAVAVDVDDQAGGVGDEARARDEVRGLGGRRGRRRRVAFERERAGVGEAPFLVVARGHRQRLEGVPALLAEDGEPVLRAELRGLGGLPGDVEDAGGGGGDGAHPTDPSICSSMRRFSSTEYSIGNSFTRSLTKPFTARDIASPSERPRCIM